MEDLNDTLVCPVDKSPLRRDGAWLISFAGRRYPVVEGVPVLLAEELYESFDLTLPVIRKSIEAARRAAERGGHSELFLDTLGISAEQANDLLAHRRAAQEGVDPVVSYLVGATCGNLYRHLVGALPRYPIPTFRLRDGAGRLMLDLGCNWGRWCFAAAREGFRTVGIDPQLGALVAAQRAARQLGLAPRFVCADARFLPFKPDTFDLVYSYSVLQHMSRENVAVILDEANRVAKPGGELLAQMPRPWGVRTFYQQVRRRFRAARAFEVRYWTCRELAEGFGPKFGPCRFSIDCFFGIGLQPADADLMPATYRIAIVVSEWLRKFERVAPRLLAVADSVYVHGFARKGCADNCQ